MKTVMQTKPLKIVGVELRTTNEVAFHEIPKLWQRFYQEGVLAQIPNKVSNDVYAVYTNFENEGKNNEGTYSLILGAEVSSLDGVPEALASTVVNAAKRRVFEVPAGQPHKVGEKWQEIWSLSDHKKTFIADYECYRESGEIEILVGIS